MEALEGASLGVRPGGARCRPTPARDPARRSAPRRVAERGPGRARRAPAAADGVAARDVGGEVGERDVDLVADAADHRHRLRDDRAHDPLVVERPEVLHRAAAPRDDRDRGRARAGASSTRSRSSARRAAGLTIDPGASSPWTLARDEVTTRASGQRRARTWQMSLQTAPVGSSRRRSSSVAPAAGASAPRRTALGGQPP